MLFRSELAATAIAAWFMAAFFGNLAAGFLGAVWSAVSVPTFFTLVGAVGALSGLLLLALSSWANRTEAAAGALQAEAQAEIDAAVLAADARH